MFYTSRFVSALVLCLMVSSTNASCLTRADEENVRSCKQELRKDPTNLNVRLSLAKALQGLKRFREAIELLEQGQVYYPGDTTTIQKLSMMQETIAWDERNNSDSNPRSNSAVSRVELIKCTSLKGKSALAACNSFLSKQPKSVEAWLAKGNALLSLSSSDAVSAILAYRKAQSLGASVKMIQKKITEAELKRQQLVQACLSTDGLLGVEACNNSLLEGSPDSADIHFRRANLLLSLQQRDAAAGAYKAALHLNPGNVKAKSELDRLTAPPQEKQPVKIASAKAPNPPEPKRVTYSNRPLTAGTTY